MKLHSEKYSEWSFNYFNKIYCKILLLIRFSIGILKDFILLCLVLRKKVFLCKVAIVLLIDPCKF